MAVLADAGASSNPLVQWQIAAWIIDTMNGDETAVAADEAVFTELGVTI